MKHSTPLIAGIELGGTKCICILGTGPDDVREQVRLPTRDPVSTLAEIEKVLDAWVARHAVEGIGIASFGPICLDRNRPSYGFITTTAKAGWSDTDVAGRIAARYSLPVGFDTDVNGAALAEGLWGRTQDLGDYAYVTVGTGIGAGLICHGQPAGGFTHSEVGHIRVQRLSGDEWAGSCPFHGDCAEGLASGTAIRSRGGGDPADLAPDDAVWPFVAHALGQLIHTLILISAPRRILLGGGVISDRPFLFPLIRAEVRKSLNGYVREFQGDNALDEYIVPPDLGHRAGPLGSLAVGRRVLPKRQAAPLAAVSG